MKPQTIKTEAPGCRIALGTYKEGEFRFHVGLQAFAPAGCDRVARFNWPVLRPSAENKYGVLPWDIPIPANYEPDGEWEPGEGQKAAFGMPAPGDLFLSIPNGRYVLKQGVCDVADYPVLRVRRIKTKHTVVEVELRLDIKPFDKGDEITIARLCGNRYLGTVTDVREIER